MTKPNDKPMKLFTSSGCLTAQALEKMAAGGLQPAGLELAQAHVSGCELCADALEGLKTWQEQNRVHVYTEEPARKEKKGNTGNVPVTFSHRVNHINERLRKRVAFHKETSVFKQKRRIGPVPAWFAVAASVVLFAGIYLILQQNRPVKENVAVNQAEYDEMVVPSSAPDSMIKSEAPAVIAENKPQAGKRRLPSPRIVNGIVTFSNDDMAVMEKEADDEHKAGIAEEVPASVPGYLGGIDNQLADSDEVTEKTVITEQTDMSTAQPAAAARSGKGVVATASKSSAQEELYEEAEVLTIVEQLPEFPGGVDKLNRYLTDNLHYPAEAKENSISGTVYVQFVVDKKGQISDAKVLRGIGSGCDEEALRVIRAMPRWKPGMQHGKPVKTRFNLPIKFSLE
jgi:TonB family protein